MNRDEFELKSYKISTSFTPEETELRDWLINQGLDCLYSLENILQGRYFNDVVTDFFFRNKETFDESKKNHYLATLVLHELKEYAGNSLNFIVKKPRYNQIISKVHKRLGKQFKHKVPISATTIQREEAIAMMILQDVIKNLSEEEIDEILKGVDLDSTQENRSRIIFETLSGAGFLALSKFLGGKLIKELAFKMLERYIMNKLGNRLGQQVAQKVAHEGAERILQIAGKKLPHYIFRGAAATIGWAFLAKDIIDVSGEASRITTPMVVQLSLYRTLDRRFGNES